MAAMQMLCRSHDMNEPPNLPNPPVFQRSKGFFLGVLVLIFILTTPSLLPHVQLHWTPLQWRSPMSVRPALSRTPIASRPLKNHINWNHLAPPPTPPLVRLHPSGLHRQDISARSSAAALDPQWGQPAARQWQWPLAAGFGAFTLAALMRNGLALTGLGFAGSLLASLVGAGVATIILHPVNTIKTRIQVGLPPIDPVKGFPGLYRGLLFGLASDLPTESIAMAMSVLFKDMFVRWQGSSLVDHTGATLFMFSIWSGALGTIASSFVEAPMEMLMKQMQTKQSKGVMQAIRTVFCTRGSFTRLINSWLVLLSRELPFGSFQFAIYEAALRAFSELFGLHVTVSALLSGALAGALSMVICAPMDVLVSRVMSEDESVDEECAKQSKPEGWEHVVEITQQIWRDEGLKGFWKGTLSGTLYYGLWACLFFAVYEAIAAVIM